MGLRDALGKFSESQAITAAARSTHFLDLGATKPQLGVGSNAPFLCIRTAVAPTAAGDTISIELRASATNDGSNLNGTEVVVMMPLVGAGGAEVACTDGRLSAAGKWVYRGQIPYELNLRYVQLYYNNTVTNGTITLDAWLEHKPQSDWRGMQVLVSNVGNP